jgi:hypothetical protein
MDVVKALDAYHRGELEEAGKELGLDPVAKKYGHAFDETKESYDRRLRAALGLPEEEAREVAPPKENAPASPPAPPASHEEDEEEDPEDEEHPPGHPHRRKRRRR